MRIVISGATGMLGRALLAKLSRYPQCEITALARQTNILEISSGNIRWLRGDLQSPKVCRELTLGADVIFHLAHSSVPLTESPDWVASTALSVQASLNLFKAAAEGGSCPKIIFASSGGAVYGGTDLDKLSKETDACNPSSIYGVEKLTIEHHLRLMSERGVIRGLVFRIANAYGELLPASRKQGLIGTAINQALRGESVRIIGSTDNVRDYIHADDICAAFLKGIDYETKYAVFNIGTGVGYSVDDVLKKIESLLGKPLSITQEALLTASVLPAFAVLNVSKARDMLGWSAKIDLHDGIKIMLDSNPFTKRSEAL